MRYLLDTHILLWYLEGNPRLSGAIADVLFSSQHELFVSAASWWEISLKLSIGKLQLATPLAEMLVEASKRHLAWLPLTPLHLLQVARIPFPPNGHRDPFDRLLIAQAQVEGLTLLSQDAKFDAYAVSRLS